MVGIDLRHHERHIVRHAIIFRVAKHRHARRGKRGFNLARDLCRQGREDNFDAWQFVGTTGNNGQRGHGSWHLAAQPPARDLPIWLFTVLLRGGQPDQFKPGMLLQKLYKTLANHARSAQNRDRDTLL